MSDGLVLVNPLKFHGTTVFAWIESVTKRLYQTVRPLCILLPNGFEKVKYSDGNMSILNGKLNVIPGFVFDGASGVAIDGVANMLAALIHDRIAIFGTTHTFFVHAEAHHNAITPFHFSDEHISADNERFLQFHIRAKARFGWIKL